MVGNKNMDVNEQNSHKVLAVNKIPLFRDLNNITRTDQFNAVLDRTNPQTSEGLPSKLLCERSRSRWGETTYPSWWDLGEARWDSFTVDTQCVQMCIGPQWSLCACNELHLSLSSLKKWKRRQADRTICSHCKVLQAQQNLASYSDCSKDSYSIQASSVTSCHSHMSSSEKTIQRGITQQTSGFRSPKRPVCRQTGWKGVGGFLLPSHHKFKRHGLRQERAIYLAFLLTLTSL